MLKNKAVTDRLLKSVPEENVVIAAGPTTKQPGTNPYRIALVALPNGFAIYNEIFEEDPFHITCPKSTFSNGWYYRHDQLHLATEEFGRRLMHNAQFIESIYREAD